MFFLLLGRPLQKAKGSIVSDWIGMKFGRIFLPLNIHRLMELDFHLNLTFKMAAMTSFHAEKCSPK